MTSDEPKVAKIQTQFQALSAVAASLNTASDELTKAVSILDEALKKLNVGLTVWVNSISVDVEPPEYDTEQIGYCKVNGKWGIALRRIWGDENADQHHEEGPWLFNDAPREMRLYGVDKIPGVIEALSKAAFNTTKRIQDKTQEVRNLATAIAEISNEPRATWSKGGISIGTCGLSPEQLEGILVGVQNHKKFLGELLMHSSRWELSRSSLRIYFPAENRSFAGLLEGRESLANVSSVAKEVLGHPVQAEVKLEPPVVIGSTTSGNKGGK